MSTLLKNGQISIETFANVYTMDHIDSRLQFVNRRKVNNQEKPILTLFDNGMINYCNKAAEKLLGYLPNELTGQHISKVFPQLAEINLVQMRRVNLYLRDLSLEGHAFEVVGKDGIQFPGELVFRDMESLGRYYLRIMIYPARQTAT